ncbi:lipopolysaccharide biosynthesis protein [Rhodobacter sp. Har01]|uniref:GumC family protein n=1 Tax=Rhodobacter sp. Har01 TaxID=2883999 RepID=UPI001D0981B2|nr:lipopolysaccharide biosynthesis protein [Rhodobacter sp. Har01]MCB6180106.1 lipopolysaccharide biosynthesis protein [Rhodobacter sp. Har01]
MSFDPKFQLSILFRRLPYFLLTVAAVLAVGLSLAVLLPAKYRSEALLVVESEQIPGNLAASTVATAAEEELQILEQQLMTRANLLEIANRFALYSDRPGLDASAIVDDMRARTTFDVRSSGGGRRAQGAVTTLNIAFDAGTAQQALDVTNDLVTRLLQANVETRTGRATQTLEFFEQEVARLGADLDRQEAEILAFTQANQNSLPDSLEYRRTRQATLQERLLQLQREQGALTERRTRLVTLYEQTGRVETAPETMTPAQKDLAEARAALESALLVYSPQNPQVKVLEARVAALEKAVAAESGAGVDTGAGTLSEYDVQLAQIDGELAYNADQRSQVERELEDLRLSIEATPGNATRLAEMQRENEITRGQYTSAVDRLAQAQTGERIESLSKGQRISIVEQPVLASEPFSPPRKTIVASSVAAAIALGLGLVLLLEVMNRAIRRPSEIEAQLGITPIATLPYVRSEHETALRRGAWIGVVALLAFGLSAAIFVVHVYVMPLDMLLDRLMQKTGLSALF